MRIHPWFARWISVAAAIAAVYYTYMYNFGVEETGGLLENNERYIQMKWIQNVCMNLRKNLHMMWKWKMWVIF